MKPQSSSRRRTRRSKIAGSARLSFTGLLTIIIAAAAVWNLDRTRDEAVESSTAKTSTARKVHNFWFIRPGQWRADARTLVAALRYVLESDSQTNQGKPEQRFPNLEVAMPTNSTLAGPKA
jgi:hypothetical protein